MDLVMRSRGTGAGEKGRQGQGRQEDWRKERDSRTGAREAGRLGLGEQALEQWEQED
jgi:hypothetical protein